MAQFFFLFLNFGMSTFLKKHFFIYRAQIFLIFNKTMLFLFNNKNNVSRKPNHKNTLLLRVIKFFVDF